ncbi:phosphoribosylanthranilate isomerase [Melghirimyces profundicolus]|uniref:N-(5'-phosphoribosyl)anthranilate isomerase n=1 Tax=Melghirimyces profundicolus TaxID=1242148 RepID=A0A2T6BV05_9BACL|nr:phosphoribosylanthranilate isomerase [Melghirimyces profundicolus]PTX59911.1 phosphoribosylanthranilate isomerase [Melghirimyces profundicolus]
MRTFVKLCGLQTPEDAEKLEGIDADAAGMIFVPGRKRTVSPERAASIVSRLPAGIRSAGVFLNPTRDEVLRVWDRVELDLIQLHGLEEPEFCRWLKENLGGRIVKVFFAGKKSAFPPEAYARWIDAVLIDSVAGTDRGGTGKTFAWNLLPEEQKRWEAWGIPVWVAGGLHPDNVNRLLTEHLPHGVDTSSGVETNGEKDRDKMKRFVERVRRHDRRVH